MLLDSVFATTSVTDLKDPRLWEEFGFLAPDTSSGVRVSPDKALGLSAYFCGVRAISEDVGKLPLVTYKRREGRGKDRATDHPVYGLLHDAPNRNMGSMTFRETLTAHAIGWGGGYAEIRKNQKGFPYALEVIHPSRVEIGDDGRGNLAYRVGNPDGTHVSIDQERMFHVRGIGPDGKTGYSVARVGAESLGRAMAAEQFGASFFKSGLSSTGMIEMPTRIKDKEVLERLRTQWRDTYAGLENHHKPIILEGGAKFTALSIPPEDAQLLETHQFSVEEIARWLRIAPHKLMHLLHATFSNIEEQNIDYVGDTLMPWLVRWEQEISRKLFQTEKRGLYFSEHLVQGLLRGNAEARSSYYRELFNIGSLSQNDIRELENKNPVEGGETYYINGAMIRSEDAAAGKTMASAEPPIGRTDGNDNVPRAQVVGLYRASVEPSLVAAFERCRTKEIKALERASKKPGSFAAWAERFYGEHSGYLLESMGATATAALEFLRGAGEPARAITLASSCESYAADNLRRALAAHEAGNVPALIEYVRGAAPTLVDELTKELFDESI